MEGFNIRLASRISPWTYSFQHYLNNSFDVGICNFADDTNTYISDESLENVLKSLEKNSTFDIPWFENDYMKLNTDKYHLIVLG